MMMPVGIVKVFTWVDYSGPIALPDLAAKLHFRGANRNEIAVS